MSRYSPGSTAASTASASFSVPFSASSFDSAYAHPRGKAAAVRVAVSFSPNTLKNDTSCRPVREGARGCSIPLTRSPVSTCCTAEIVLLASCSFTSRSVAQELLDAACRCGCVPRTPMRSSPCAHAGPATPRGDAVLSNSRLHVARRPAGAGDEKAPRSPRKRGERGGGTSSGGRSRAGPEPLSRRGTLPRQACATRLARTARSLRAHASANALVLHSEASTRSILAPS